MKRTFVTIAILLAFAMLAVMIGQSITDAQRPNRQQQQQQRAGQQRPGQRGMAFGPEALMRGMSFDRTWMALSFEMDTTDEQLVQTRAAYMKAWKSLREQGEIMREQMQAGAQGENAREARREMFESMRTTAKEIQAELDTSLKEILTEEQHAKLVEIRTKDQERMRQQMRGGRQGGPQGGARPGGNQGPPR